ncbi:hypothetical protein [Actinoplanes philippinensis]|uniref:hypothetical protein n=1 Tax=Actinoplanes philippinensis TaxID=35752 RepID=UPI0011601759|nr:hypothetical protein [Actinoplanes philippinensis]
MTKRASTVIRRPGVGAVFGGVVLLGFGALAVLVLVLLVSPASFVSLMPGWLAKDGSTSSAVWLVAGLSAALAVVVAVRRGPVRWLRGTVITVLVTGALLCGVYAFATGPAGRSPVPENTCVAYSGGRHTCPGG